MNLSIQNKFYLFTEELQQYLFPHILQQIAQETGFIKRKSKYDLRDLTADLSTGRKRFSYLIM